MGQIHTIHDLAYRIRVIRFLGATIPWGRGRSLLYMTSLIVSELYASSVLLLSADPFRFLAVQHGVHLKELARPHLVTRSKVVNQANLSSIFYCFSFFARMRYSLYMHCISLVFADPQFLAEQMARRGKRIPLRQRSLAETVD